MRALKGYILLELEGPRQAISQTPEWSPVPAGHLVDNTAVYIRMIISPIFNVRYPFY